MPSLRPSKAPALPLAPKDYDAQAFSRANNVLRLYFNQIDNILSGLLAPLGGQYLNLPHGAFQNSATQSLAAANTPYVVQLDTTDFSNGVSLASNQMTVVQAGIYNCQFSLQFENTTAQIVEVWVWLRKNGVDIDGTASIWAVTSTHGGINGYMIGACNFFVGLDAGDYIELVIAANATGINIEAYTASTSPFTRPSIPSSVVTLAFVSST